LYILFVLFNQKAIVRWKMEVFVGKNLDAFATPAYDFIYLM
jgi:hypothetical protein